MKHTLLLFIAFSFTLNLLEAQTLLDANGSGNTYEDINAVLAPGFNAVEVPDCNHTSFGRHIDEVFDTDLNTNVFRFIAHVTPDDDRCIKFDRQRTEIKAYDKSPDNLKAVDGETVVYKWKFKLSAGFQPSTSFTHIHQIKSVGGPFDGTPMYTLTARKASSGDRLELRHAATDTQVTLTQTLLAPFLGTWVSVEETITYGANGSYTLEIKNTSTDAVLFSHNDSSIVNWQTDAEFARPKWGIYRSLINAVNLQDEEVRFANFSIEEIQSLSVDDFNFQSEKITLSPNPASDYVTIKNLKIQDYNTLSLYDISGRVIPLDRRLNQNKLNVNGLASGVYFITLKSTKDVLKLIVD